MALLAVATGAVGAETEIRFSRLGMAEGLSQSSVMAITQCHDGFMWFGTQYGLDRFDGREVRSFRHQASDPETLGHSRITALMTGADGAIWVGNVAGLDRFDPRTGRAERFEFAFVPAPGGPRNISHIVAEHPDGRIFVSLSGLPAVWHPDDGQVHAIPFDPPIEHTQLALRSELLDRKGRFWSFNAAGLWQLDEATQRMRLVLPMPQTPRFIQYSALALTPDGRLALAADDEFLLVDADTLEVLERLTLEDLGGVDARLNAVMSSSDGAVWLPTPSRLLRYTPADRSLDVIVEGVRLSPTENARQQLKMVEHPNWDLWFASQYGLGHVDAASGQVRLLSHDPADPYSIPQSLPQIGIAIEIDDEGNLWVGTHLGGAAWHAPARSVFRHIRDQSSVLYGGIPFPSQNVIRSIVELRQGEQLELWLALHHAGIRRLRAGEDGEFQWYQSFHGSGEDGERLPEDAVWSLAVDPLSGLVWALGSNYLTLIDPAADRVVRSVPLSEFGFPAQAGRRLLISRDGGRLWVGSWSGVRELTLAGDRTRPVLADPQVILPELGVFGLVEDDDGGVLVFGEGGIGRFRPGAAGTDWFFDSRRLGKNPLVPLNALVPHPEEGWWIAGRETGLGHLRVEAGADGKAEASVEWFGKADGLVDDTVYAMLPEGNGRLWLSSNRGLMRWDPALGEVRQFTPADGLQSYEFNTGVAHRGEDGDLYFGGINGVNQFRPEHFDAVLSPPRLRLLEVRVNGQLVEPALDEHAPLRLRHDQNDLEIRFAGLNFADPARVRHAFRLEGVDPDWVDGGSRRQVRYASLQPGTYRFHLRAANSDDVWSDPEVLLTAVVASPPWATPWALAAYGLMLIGLAGLAFGEHHRRRRALEAEVAVRTATLSEQRGLIERQARELEQSLEARTVLFANVSHEFRTPLTLIKTSLDRLERQGADADAIALGRRYLRRLLKLVDQLMDFSRLSHEQRRLEFNPWPLGRMVRMTVDAFSGVAQERGIELVADIEYGWRTQCLQEQVEKILLNLLTNALKFTPPGGQVRVALGAQTGGVCLSVADSGPGIPESEQATIFERFYRVQAAENSEIAGAGIGLALVREAVRANGGWVSVSSRPGHGSRFSVWLPAWREPNAAGPVTLLTEREHARDIEALKPLEPGEPSTEAPADAAQPAILVIEDNPDMRAHLSGLLRPQWRVIEAGDGNTGLALAQSEAPELIVSDIMMPGLDGLELLEALRSDIRTSHVPIMLLTARQDHDTRVRAFSLQTDDFLAKPFDDNEFLVRLSAMLETRRRLHERLRRELAGGPVIERKTVEPEVSERDAALLERLQAWIEIHHADPDIKVTDMARAALVDVRTLQRKLKALLDCAPASLLQEVRLEKARELLVGNERSIKDIAASCGFSSPQSFSKVFSQAEGLPPSQWRRRAQSRTRHH